MITFGSSNLNAVKMLSFGFLAAHPEFEDTDKTLIKAKIRNFKNTDF